MSFLRPFLHQTGLVLRSFQDFILYIPPFR
jgi:hypothetical protein